MIAIVLAGLLAAAPPASPPHYQRPIHNPATHWPFWLTFTMPSGSVMPLMSYPTMDLCNARLAMIQAKGDAFGQGHACRWLTPPLGQ